MSYVLYERNSTNWFGYKVENERFEGVGGPENLTEILAYFLDTFIPTHIDPSSTLDVYLPIVGHEGHLWRYAETRMITESAVEIISITDSKSPNAIVWRSDEELDLMTHLKNSSCSLRTDFQVGDIIEPTVFQVEHSMLDIFLVAPVKK